jgi:hypothetical protein
MNPAMSSATPLQIVRPMAAYESLPGPFGLADTLMPKSCHVVYFIQPKVEVKPKAARRKQEYRCGRLSAVEMEARYQTAGDVIKRMWAEGADAYVIQEATGIHRSSIMRWLQRNGLHQPVHRPRKTEYGSHRKIFEGNLGLIKQMIAEGKRNVDICEHFGMDRATIGRYVAEMNLRAK